MSDTETVRQKAREIALRAAEKAKDLAGRPFMRGMFVGVLVTVLAGLWYVDNREDAFREQVAEANQEAVNWELAWRDAANAYEERAWQAINAEALLENVRTRNEQLAEDLEDRNLEVLSLTETNSRLEAALDSSESSVAQEDSVTYRVALDESVHLAEGGFVRVSGDVVVETVGPSVEAALGVTGEFPLSVVLSRNDDGEIVVNAFTGDPRLTVTQVDVQRLAERPASTGIGGALEAVGEHITSGSVWLGRLEGAAACMILK